MAGELTPDLPTETTGVLNRTTRTLRTASRFAIWLLAVVVSLAGSAIIAEQAVYDIFGREEILIGPWAISISAYLAVISLFLINASIYFEHLPRHQPTKVGRVFLSPLAILTALVLFVLLVRNGHLTEKYVDGASLLALGGALFRTRGFPRDAF
jgi:hypothetical protein